MIKEKKVLTEEEIKELKELKASFDGLVYSLGSIEAEINVLENSKIEIKKKLIELTDKEKSVAKKLKTLEAIKYITISISRYSYLTKAICRLVEMSQPARTNWWSKNLEHGWNEKKHMKN